MRNDVFGRLIAFLDELGQRRIHYQLAHFREEALMVQVSVPGQRWEIEFLVDGSVEIEKFVSNGEIHGEEALKELFEKYSD